MLDVKILLTKILQRLTDIGTAYSNSANKTISNTNIDTYTNGAYVTLPAGTYVVTGLWQFNSRSSSGTTNSQVGLRVGSTGSIRANVRVFAAAANWNSLGTTDIIQLAATSDVYVCGSTTRAYTTASPTYVTAVRIR